MLDIDDLDSDNWRGFCSEALVVPSDRTVAVMLVRYTVRLLDGPRAGQMATAGHGIREGHVVLEGDRRFGRRWLETPLRRQAQVRIDDGMAIPEALRGRRHVA